LFIGRGFVVAASILEGDYLENYQHVEPVRAVRILINLKQQFERYSLLSSY
jgi:hypothetical protein